MVHVSDILADYCRTNRIMYSSRRKEVVNALDRFGDFITAESLWLRIRRELRISVGSVYLILNWLVKLGFAEECKNEGKKKLFRIILSNLPKSSHTL